MHATVRCGAVRLSAERPAVSFAYWILRTSISKIRGGVGTDAPSREAGRSIGEIACACQASGLTKMHVNATLIPAANDLRQLVNMQEHMRMQNLV